MEKAIMHPTRHTRRQLLDMLKLEEAAVAARTLAPIPGAPHRHLDG